MKLNKIMLAAVVAFGTISVAHAASNQGSGKVSFEGSIIDAPCSISPESTDQSVFLGQVANAALKNGGTSIPKAFEIALENCEIEKGKENVSVTFSGVESTVQPGKLALNGTAKGASIAITDGSGKLLKLGEASPASEVVEGNTNLRFTAYLQGDGASTAIVPGDFTSVANFTMAYQ
ncbi:fimbrial protein [Serratia liquefaciens]|uniref:fimbrial protein n=1 Tax=Serratia liquefaciens TaxID=614 RepID=UPI0023629D13|nr:fimbrial protein [Serratia liquefaciens]